MNTHWYRHIGMCTNLTVKWCDFEVLPNSAKLLRLCLRLIDFFGGTFGILCLKLLAMCRPRGRGHEKTLQLTWGSFRRRWNMIEPWGIEWLRMYDVQVLHQSTSYIIVLDSYMLLFVYVCLVSHIVSACLATQVRRWSAHKWTSLSASGVRTEAPTPFFSSSDSHHKRYHNYINYTPDHELIDGRGLFSQSGMIWIQGGSRNELRQLSFVWLRHLQ